MILVKSVSRFARNTEELLNVIRALNFVVRIFIVKFLGDEINGLYIEKEKVK